MSISLKQWFIYGIEISFDEAEALGFDDDYWENFHEAQSELTSECDHGTLPNGLNVVMYINSSKYYFGQVLVPDDRYDGAVLSQRLKDLFLTADAELLVDIALQELKIPGEADYLLVTAFD